MNLRLMLMVGLLSMVLIGASAPPPAPVAIQSPSFETRCGWFVNPTPGNIWLDDRDGEWIIGVQGGHQVEGDWPWPAFKRGQWVRTNAGSYGYGCACLQLRVNKQTQEVLEIKSSQPRSLAQCRRDPALKKWSGKLRG